jgi:hypothetical protein
MFVVGDMLFGRLRTRTGANERFAVARAFVNFEAMGLLVLDGGRG